jgi:hypothetical protein
MTASPNHGGRDHAPFSPSSAGRWTKCVQSVLMTESIPEDRKNSPDVRFGEMCHEGSETALTHNMTASAIKDMAEALVWPEGFTAEDAIDVIIAYVGYVETRTAELNLLYGEDDVVVLVEKKLQLIKDECFGTPDCALVWPDGIEVIDLKGGAGYAVDAERNEQLLTYAAMLAKKYKRSDGLLKLTIVQPRRTDGKGAVDTWEDKIEAATAWGKHLGDVIKEARANPTQPPVPGAHCHWCKAHERCPAQHAEATKLLTVIDENAANAPVLGQSVAPEMIAPEMLSQIVEKAPIIVKWLKAVIAYATENPPPGWKLVEGSADREWRPDAEVAKILEVEKIPLKTFDVTKRAGITDTVKILKMIGRPELQDVLFIKPKGKPTLAPLNDPRPAANKTDALSIIA